MTRTALFIVLLLAFPFCGSASESFVLTGQSDDNGHYELKIPKKTREISFTAVLGMPVSEDTVPTLVVYFPGKREKVISKLKIGDSECTGEYNSQIEYYQKKKKIKTQYFRNKTPWPESIDVIMTINHKSSMGYEHSLNINGEVMRYSTEEKFKTFEISTNGTVEISGLSFDEGERE